MADQEALSARADSDTEISDEDFATAVDNYERLMESAPLQRAGEAEGYSTSTSVPLRTLNYREQLWALPITRECRRVLGLDHYPPTWLVEEVPEAS